ncbi:LPS export ABC transporter periplasmic protein LptC [Microvirga thermotolerans]|uniref:LPS export ABC transporter periplasmic protein LptC n=1 Tax=Microvirga thermotolerans TaxID=2651334 RepID=A0A5P9JQF4_9HYPH|nr:LPS export ABC transporter periplasmic protein LptC [Microvirga thermotolerans]QFU14867.1 LPS export ABC transporter periplasmic protein LptC [Microvirga thermotolerans]
MGTGPAAPSRSRLRDFSQARRHSRRVRFAKIAIPVGSLIALAVVVLFAYFNPFRNIRGLSVESVGVNGTQVTMESPRLTGFRNDNRPYEVTASQATQDVRKPNFVELKDLRARVVTDDKGSAARLQAAFGVLDTQKEQMNLRQEVRVHTDAGQQVDLRSAFVDFKAGRVLSEEPVTVTLSNGRIEAEGLEVTENGKVMHFKGRVRTTFANGPSGSSTPSAAGPDGPPAQPTSLRP